MSEIIQFDFELFQMIHFGIKNAFFDILMPIVREKYVWLPFYLFIILFSFSNMTFKKASIVIAGIILTVVLADFISSQTIKKRVQRVRPCNEFSLISEVNPLVNCGSGFSFPSSHAANHFALVLFLIFSKKIERTIYKTALFSWAGIISFAQIYVGLHYPFDILGGILVGYASARIISLILFAIERRGST